MISVQTISPFTMSTLTLTGKHDSLTFDCLKAAAVALNVFESTSTRVYQSLSQAIDFINVKVDNC